MTRATRLCALLLLCSAGACKSPETPAAEPGSPPVSAVPAPAYAEMARLYNQNATRLDQLFAPVTVRIRYYDKAGEEHKEEGDGRLQVVQPSHVALNIGKLGETYFWLGSDSQRYWWIDLSRKVRSMYVGTHGNYEQSQARRIGVVVAPQDLVRLLGIVPLPATGQTQWSSDGKLVGLTTELDLGARQRTWIDPKTGLPEKIEIFNAKGECELVSGLSIPDTVSMRTGVIGPTMNTRVIIAHDASKSQITLDLSNMQDGSGRIVPDAFDAELLARQWRAEKIYDLDLPPKSETPAGAQQPVR